MFQGFIAVLFRVIFYFSIVSVLVSNKLPEMSEQEAYNINLFQIFLFVELHSTIPFNFYISSNS